MGLVDIEMHAGLAAGCVLGALANLWASVFSPLHAAAPWPEELLCLCCICLGIASASQPRALTHPPRCSLRSFSVCRRVQLADEYMSGAALAGSSGSSLPETYKAY